MAVKYKCDEIWKFWSKGWICMPTAPENPNNKFPSEVGRYMVSKFPGLEKNYERLCKVGRGKFAVFASKLTREDEPQKILSYSDLRIPLCSDDFGIILTPDEAGSREEKKDTEKTDWEVIEETVDILKRNLHLIPGTIYLPPLGYGKNRMEEEDAVDELMALLLDVDRVEILYGFKTEINTEESQQEDHIEEEQGTINDEQQESIEVYSSENNKQEWNGENLIDNEFDRIEVKLPD